MIEGLWSAILDDVGQFEIAVGVRQPVSELEPLYDRLYQGANLSPPIYPARQELQRLAGPKQRKARLERANLGV